MGVELESCSIVVRGNFNPHIITPDWLKKENIWDIDEVELRLSAQGSGLQFRSSNVQWLVDSDRLNIESKTKDCGDFAAKILEKLPHTPVVAVGSNFVFAANIEDWKESPKPMLGNTSVADRLTEWDLEEQRWSGVFQKSDVRIEAAIRLGADNVVVSSNHHRHTRNTNEAIKAAREFLNDKDQASELLNCLFEKQFALGI